VARTGKIARLPLILREKINARILDGEKFRSIIKWLNELPDVQAVLQRDFSGDPINDQNFSDWHLGGYREWLSRRERIERTREMAKWSMQMAEASGGNLAEGAASILAGRILEILEGLDALVHSVPAEGEKADAKERLELIAGAVDQLTLSVSRLRKGDQNAESLRILRERLAQSAQSIELERQRFQRQTCELFLRWRDNDRARSIADGPGTTEEKVEQLGHAMFGDLWK
jgi:hypothetical protein